MARSMVRSVVSLPGGNILRSENLVDLRIGRIWVDQKQGETLARQRYGRFGRFCTRCKCLESRPTKLNQNSRSHREPRATHSIGNSSHFCSIGMLEQLNKSITRLTVGEGNLLCWMNTVCAITRQRDGRLERFCARSKRLERAFQTRSKNGGPG